MHWQSMSDFWAMGGHGLFVWGSYAVTAAVLGVEGVLLVQRRQRALQAVRQQRLLNDSQSGRA